MTVYTLFGQANPGATSAGTGNNGTNGLHFNVSAASALQGIWHYSPSGATQLPATIGLYTITTLGTSGTLVHSETVSSWSGAAGSGWVLALFASPPSLSPGTEYMATQFRNDAVNRWFDFYAVTWPVSSGILTAPKDESTSALSQGWYNIGTAMAFPTTQSGTAGSNFGMDVQVSTGSPYTPPQGQVRGKPARARARLKSSPAPAPAVPAVPSRFRLPGLARGRAQGRKARNVPPRFPLAIPPVTRSPYTWPFSWDSIWNLPVAATATYAPTGITVTSDYSTDPSAVEYCSTDPAQPVKSLTNALLPSGSTGAASVYVAPAMSAPGTWNDCGAFLGTDLDTVYQGQTLSLTAGGNPSWGGTADIPSAPVLIKSQGITGSHGGSGLSALGGTLTAADLTGAGPISHAMKLCFNGFLYYSSAGTGFQWPAVSADGGYNNPADPNYYGGSNAAIVLGALLALPPWLSPSKYSDPLVQKIAAAMQAYGAYLVDNTASGAGVSNAIIELNYDAVSHFAGTGTFSSDFHQMLMDLQVVTNSAQATPGGGAIGANRFAPYAPAFSDGSDAPPPATTVSPSSVLMQSLTDSFPGSTLSPQWGSYGTVAVSGGQCGIACGTSESGIFSAAGRTLTGSYMLAKVTPYTGGTGPYTYFQAVAEVGSGGAGIQYNSGSLWAYWISSGGTVTNLASIPYDPVAHAWWRVREDPAASTTYFDTSPDGASWTNRWSVADPVSYSSMMAQAGSAIGSGTAGNTFLAAFNVPPAVPSPFAPPVSIWRAHMAARKSRLGSSAGSPAVPPPPFQTPRSITRAHQAARKARLSSARGTAVPPPPFATPRRVQRGQAAARKSRLGSSAGSPSVTAPVTPSPFSVPALLRRGKAAARKARLAVSAGSPSVPTQVAVAGTWTGSYAVASGFFFPFPAARPVQIAVANTPGDWLFALVAWRPSTTGSGVSVCVADDAHNWWEPVGAPLTDSGPSGAVRTAVWAAPAARVANSVTGVTNVQVAATGPVLSLACTIVDMSGMQPWYQAAVTAGNFGNAVTSLALSSAAPPASAVLLAAFGSDNNADTVTGPAGWTALPGASASNGTDATADIKLTPAWQVATGAASASVSSSGSLDLSGVIAGVLVSAPQPAQPNPNWPVMVTEAAIGSGVQTPPSQMTWTPLSGRSLALSITQGRQYSLGQLQAGQGTITLDDPDGALIPPGAGPYAGIDSGTPLRRRVTWPGLPGSPNLTPNYVAFSGYFRRWPWNMDPAMYRGQVQAEITDTWGYGNGQLNSMGIEECLIDSPHSLWPLTDPPGSAGAGSVVPNGAPLPLVTSKYGAGGATVTWGANSGTLKGMSSAQVKQSGAPGGASGMWQQALAGLSLGANGYGYALVANDAAFPALVGGVTVETWAQFTGTATGPQAIAFTATASNSQFALTAPVATGSAVVLGVAGGFTFPSGVTAGTTYYVIGNGGTNVQLSATPGGGAVTVTADGQGYIQVVIPWNPVIFSARDGKGTVFGLSIRGSDGALLLLSRSGTSVTTTAVDTGHDYRTIGLFSVSLAVTQATWRVITDGGQFLAASGTFAAPLPASFRTLSLGGIQDATAQGNAFSGYLALPGVYPGVSQQARVLSRYWAAGAGMTNEAACDRVERLLEYAGLAGRRWLGQQAVAYEGDLLASGQDTGGQAPVSSINNVVQSTLPAYAAVAPTGDTVYRAKLYTWNEPVRWTLGDSTAAGEIPFAPGGAATDYDPSRVTADVQLTQLDTQAVTVPAGVMSATTMAAVAAAAARQYVGQPYQQTGYLTLDWSSAYNAGSSLADLANWVQAVYAKPASRIASVTVDAARHPAAWPFWAAAAVGDMVQVNVRLPTAATSPLISLTARITQTSRSSQFSQGGTSATIAATLDFAPEYNALTCDDPVRGLLNGTNVMPW